MGLNSLITLILYVHLKIVNKTNPESHLLNKRDVAPNVLSRANLKTSIFCAFLAVYYVLQAKYIEILIYMQIIDILVW